MLNASAACTCILLKCTQSPVIFWWNKWHLFVPSSPADRITLTFTTLHLQIMTVNCSSSYVQVYNGDDDDGILRGTYCGTTAPGSITSTGSAMFVRFVSGPVSEGAGFRAVYTKSLSGTGNNKWTAGMQFLTMLKSKYWCQQFEQCDSRVLTWEVQTQTWVFSRTPAQVASISNQKQWVA